MSELVARLSQACECYQRAEPEMIAKVVRAVREAAGADLPDRDARLLAEIEELGRTIAEAKAEIAALQVNDVSSSQIPSATDELDAVVAHTAAATNEILEVCETLDQVAESLDGPQAQLLQDATMRIYEACGFQDITGQRITKVVNALKFIDAKVNQIMLKFGDNTIGQEKKPTIKKELALSEADLLNGPQMPATAFDQSEIDRLLADF